MAINEEYISALDERKKVEKSFRIFQELMRSLDRVEIQEIKDPLVTIEKYLITKRNSIN